MLWIMREVPAKWGETLAAWWPMVLSMIGGVVLLQRRGGVELTVAAQPVWGGTNWVTPGRPRQYVMLSRLVGARRMMF